VKNGDQGHETSLQKRRAVWLMIQAGLGSFTGMSGMNDIVKIQTSIKSRFSQKTPSMISSIKVLILL